MSRFTLNIDTDNAAFEDDPGRELARILLELVENRTALNIDPGDRRYGANAGTVRDENGNTCGRWTWTDDERDELEPRGDYGPEELAAQDIRDAGRGHLLP